jgi:hypothetical protein
MIQEFRDADIDKTHVNFFTSKLDKLPIPALVSQKFYLSIGGGSWSPLYSREYPAFYVKKQVYIAIQIYITYWVTFMFLLC